VKHRVVSAFLRAGVCLSKQADEGTVRDLIASLHPVTTCFPLIRIGDDGDGGYLLPDDLDGISACFSPGVSHWAPFETDLIGRGIPCFLADASVDEAPIKGASFIKKFVGVIDDDTTIRLDDWVAEFAPNEGDLLLQMDIEGAEWPVLLNASAAVLRRFRIMVIEFHDLERLMDEHALPIIAGVFARLLRDFHIVHNHPNNYGRTVHKGDLVIPRVMEMTFLRKDRAEASGFATTFPHPFDRTNAPHQADVALPTAWYGG